MPTVRKSDEVIAILCSDLHLSTACPAFRSGEPDWWAAMKRPLAEIKGLSETYEAPVICAGDVFDRWFCYPELINFAITQIPHMLAVPGQHDLPNHNMEEIERSAFWTLVMSGTINAFTASSPVIAPGKFVAYGFGWGCDIRPVDAKHTAKISGALTGREVELAVCHRYAWMDGKGYPNAPQDAHIKAMSKKALMSYDVVLFGDNHNAFLTKLGDTTVYNSGTMMRRKLDECDYKPQVGLLYQSGRVEPYYLDTSKDVYLSAQQTTAKQDADLTAFIAELNKLGKSALDFREAVKQYLDCHEIRNTVRDVIMKAMDV